MKFRTILLTVLAILALSSTAYASQPASSEAPDLEVSNEEALLAEVAEPAAESADAPSACAEDQVASAFLAADPMDEIIPQAHDCGDGFHVDSCEECPRFFCACSPFRVCCYCE